MKMCGCATGCFDSGGSSRRPSYFLLNGQKKVTKEKAAPAARHPLRFSLQPGLARGRFGRYASSYAAKVLGKPSMACPFAAVRQTPAPAGEDAHPCAPPIGPFPAGAAMLGAPQGTQRQRPRQRQHPGLKGRVSELPITVLEQRCRVRCADRFPEFARMARRGPHSGPYMVWVPKRSLGFRDLSANSNTSDRTPGHSCPGVDVDFDVVTPCGALSIAVSAGKGPQGTRMEARPRQQVQGCAFWRAPAETRSARVFAPPGRPFLCLLSFGRSKESRATSGAHSPIKTTRGAATPIHSPELSNK